MIPHLGQSRYLLDIALSPKCIGKMEMQIVHNRWPFYPFPFAVAQAKPGNKIFKKG